MKVILGILLALLIATVAGILLPAIIGIAVGIILIQSGSIFKGVIAIVIGLAVEACMLIGMHFDTGGHGEEDDSICPYCGSLNTDGAHCDDCDSYY